MHTHFANKCRRASLALFLRNEGGEEVVFGPADPVFLKWGFRRGPLQLRSLSLTPNPLPASNLIYKLRALFGVQARCEVLLWLLGNRQGRPAEIARATCYFPKTVEDTLKELAASSLVREVRSGRERHYGLDPENWSFFRSWKQPAGFPDWVDWPRRFAVVERILAVLGRGDLSGLLLASELRRVMEESEATLAEGGLASAFAASRQHTGLLFTDTLAADLGRLLEA